MTAESIETRTGRISSYFTMRNIAVVVVAAALLSLPGASNALNAPSLTGLLTQVLIYSIAAMSLNLVLGYGGMVTFGHAAFFGTGGYVVGILYQDFADSTKIFGFLPGTDNLTIALLAALLVGAAVSTVIGSLSLRTSGVPFIMITLAFAQMLYFLFVSLKAYGGDDGLMMRRRDVLPLIDVRDDVTYYYVCLTLALGWFLVSFCLVRSRFGAVISGLRQNERRMVAIGVSPYPYRLVVFVIAGAGAALSGALMANYSRFVSPDMMHWTKSGELMMMVILGGAGSLVGPILGAGALVVLETVLAAQTENWQFYLGVILLTIVMSTHGGLAALVRGKGIP